MNTPSRERPGEQFEVQLALDVRHEPAAAGMQPTGGETRCKFGQLVIGHRDQPEVHGVCGLGQQFGIGVGRESAQGAPVT